uniref:CSON004724 protein n=1 Tax=Culicoides sonorensis TaxID=179676 RepID=A0A336K839_CULSO
MGTGTSRTSESPSGKINFSTFKARIDRVKINGVQRTYDDYLERTSKKLFAAKNVQELLDGVKETRAALLELGVFKNLSATVDTSKGKDASPYGYEVNFYGEELSRITGSVGTEIDQHEGCFVSELSTPNLFGRGERLSLNGSYSNLKTSELQLKFFKPYYHTRYGDYKPEISFALLRHASLFDWSKFKTEQTGVAFETSGIFPIDTLVHTLRYELYVRDTIAMFKHTPFFVREYCGPKLANVLSYNVVYDQRDSHVFPTEGIRVSTSHHLINSSFKKLGYLKNDLHAELNCPLFAGMSVQLSGRVGKIVPLGDAMEPIAISDKFFLGGPQTLRGFVVGGAGEQKEGAATGADIYWLAAAHLWSPLPFSQYFGQFGQLFRTQIFCNVGHSGDFTTENLRGAIGVGLAFRLGDRARIELNYTQPYRTQKGDLPKAFQFGIGYDFT